MWALREGVLLAAGCGSKYPFSYVQASGKVSYEAGTLILIVESSTPRKLGQSPGPSADHIQPPGRE